MKELSALKVKLFADCANMVDILTFSRHPAIKGFTTNPTLMRQAGIVDYGTFGRELISAIPDRPISFEVFADEFDEMERQAHKISTWGTNVYVKIPITNTRSESASPLLKRLASSGVKLNVTALMTLDQVQTVAACLAEGPPAYISIFAGRIADTGRDPLPIMAKALEIMQPYQHLELLWASPRELLNIFQADELGCHVITLTHDILKKLPLIGKDLTSYSLETVKMFYTDAQQVAWDFE